VARRESGFQGRLIKKLERMFPDCEVLKNDPGYRQGIPDLIILWGPHWATLECKASEDAPWQENQPYYVEKMNRMSFSAFIYPENESEVLRGLQQAFGA
jgi:hypothetical protein